MFFSNLLAVGLTWHGFDEKWKRLPARRLSRCLTTASPLRQPLLQPVELLRPPRGALTHPALGRQIAPHRLPIAPQRCRYPTLAPTQRPQPQHRCDFVRRPHLLSSQLVKPRATLS